MKILIANLISKGYRRSPKNRLRRHQWERERKPRSSRCGEAAPYISITICRRASPRAPPRLPPPGQGADSRPRNPPGEAGARRGRAAPQPPRRSPAPRSRPQRRATHPRGAGPAPPPGRAHVRMHAGGRANSATPPPPLHARSPTGGFTACPPGQTPACGPGAAEPPPPRSLPGPAASEL